MIVRLQHAAEITNPSNVVGVARCGTAQLRSTQNQINSLLLLGCLMPQPDALSSAISSAMPKKKIMEGITEKYIPAKPWADTHVHALALHP